MAIGLTSGCDRVGSRHGASDKTFAPPSPPPVAVGPTGPAETGRANAEQAGGARAAQADRCVTPRAAPPPAIAPAATLCPADPGAPPRLPSGQVRFVDAPAAPRVSVELALSDAARTRGLMYRTELGADSGMLFSWNEEEPRSFWMRNTCIPLDMLFIAADGTIVGILEQVPTLNTLPRAIPCPAQHVLELNAGWTRQHGIDPGQRVEFET